MKNMTVQVSQETQVQELDLTNDEVQLIRNYRAMRGSARKMVFDISAEFVRNFPDPAGYEAAPS